MINDMKFERKLFSGDVKQLVSGITQIELNKLAHS